MKSGETVLVHLFSYPSPGVINCLFAGTYGSLRCVWSQLLSEADLPENHGCPNLFLPRHWNRHVKSALFLDQLGEPEDRAERFIQLVCDAGGQLADRG